MQRGLDFLIRRPCAAFYFWPSALMLRMAWDAPKAQDLLRGSAMGRMSVVVTGRDWPKRVTLRVHKARQTQEYQVPAAAREFQHETRRQWAFDFWVLGTLLEIWPFRCVGSAGLSG